MALDTNRVVVLPFKVIGTANETADMGYGLVSTLTSKLQPLQNLVVIAKESARKFKDSEKSPREIGQALGAGTIVTGEIQTGGGNIQVNIQLINANTEALGWGSTFTKSRMIFSTCKTRSPRSSRAEQGGLDAAEAQQLAQKATDNAEAQAEYESGRREWNRRNKEGFENAIQHFERAIELDPDYAERNGPEQHLRATSNTTSPAPVIPCPSRASWRRKLYLSIQTWEVPTLLSRGYNSCTITNGKTLKIISKRV